MSQQIKLPGGIKLLLAAQFVTLVAIIGESTVLGKQVFDMTGRELDLGFLGLAEFLPTMLLVPFTGSIADRHDRRYVTAITIGAEAVIAIALFTYMRTDPTSLGPIFVLAVAFGVARAFMAPSIRALPADMASTELLPRVVALGSVSLMAGVVVGPVVAGFMFVVGPQWPYALAAGLLIFSAYAVLRLPQTDVAKLTTQESGAGMVSQALEGLKFIRRTPILFGAISLDLFAVLLGGVVALLPAIAENRLGVGAIGLGWLRGATGIGAALTAIYLTRRPISRRIGKVLLIAVAAFGFGTIILGLTRSYAVAFAALLLLGSADAVSVFIRATLVPLVTPEAMRGRVLAVEAVFIGASNELGAFESGVTAAFFGLVGAIMFGGFGTLAVVAAWWMFFPALRSVDRFSDVVVPSETADLGNQP